MSSPIEFVHLRRGQNLNFASFYSGIKQIIEALLGEVSNSEETPEVTSEETLEVTPKEKAVRS